jgi:hypothetical protein
LYFARKKHNRNSVCQLTAAGENTVGHWGARGVPGGRDDAERLPDRAERARVIISPGLNDLPFASRLAMNHFPRGCWLERRILKIMCKMGFLVPISVDNGALVAVQLNSAVETYINAFLGLAHQQGKLDRDVKDKVRVRLFFSHLLREPGGDEAASLARTAYLAKVTRDMNAQRDALVVAAAEQALADAKKAE